MKITRRPRRPHLSPKPVKRLTCTSSTMKTDTSRYSRIDRLNDLNSTAGATILINVAVTAECGPIVRQNVMPSP